MLLTNGLTNTLTNGLTNELINFLGIGNYNEIIERRQATN